MGESEAIGVVGGAVGNAVGVGVGVAVGVAVGGAVGVAPSPDTTTTPFMAVPPGTLCTWQ